MKYIKTFEENNVTGVRFKDFDPIGKRYNSNINDFPLTNSGEYLKSSEFTITSEGDGLFLSAYYDDSKDKFFISKADLYIGLSNGSIEQVKSEFDKDDEFDDYPDPNDKDSNGTEYLREV